MRRLIRGVFKLALLSGLWYVVYRLIADEPVTLDDATPSTPPSAPPARPPQKAGTSPQDTRPASAPSQPSVRSIGVGEVPDHIPKWVEPIGNGTCPPSHPVKAKVDSGIFHVPGGRYYDRVTPDRCYRDAAAAESDGLRPSKQ